MKPLKPCGTLAAYKRHIARKEPVDPDCAEASRTYAAERRRLTGKPTRVTLTETEYIEEIVFLLNCGEGEHAILQALGTRQDALERRLHRAKRRDLIHRIFEWKLAA
jgi:hypothetical protein